MANQPRQTKDPAAEERANIARDRRDTHTTNSKIIFWCFIFVAGVAVADATMLIDGLIWLVGFVANFINYLFENSPWTDEEAKSATKTLIYVGYVVAIGVGLLANRLNKIK